jgi:hypothetical protein
MQHKESLTHNPGRAYRADAFVPPPGDKVELSPVEAVKGKKKVDLSKSDPSPENVRAVLQSATQRRDHTEVNEPPMSETLDPIDQLEDFYYEDEDLFPAAPGSAHKKGFFMTETAAPQPPLVAAPRKPRELPKVVLNHPDYSSTMALLQLTKKEVEEHAKDISAISSILTLPGSIELKRTVAKMFADPKHAADISRQELERKEHRYEEDRNRQLLKQAEQLKKEREILKQELDSLKM